MPARVIYEFGQRLCEGSKLVFISEADKIANKQRAALFRCDCGDICVKTIKYVKNGDCKSCGCNYAKFPKSNKAANNKYGRELYKVWCGIIDRVQNPKCKHYYNYGGRGISIDPSWTGEEGFINFAEDLGPKPSSKHSIDRIDSNGDYTSDNCQWATRSEQNFNRRPNPNNTSKKAGVRKIDRLEKWQVMISKEGTCYYLGVFDNLEDAIKTREEAEIELYGRKLNY